MSMNKNLKARVAELETRKKNSTYQAPTIVVEVIQPDKSCSKVIVHSGPFAGSEFNREEGESSAEFQRRVDEELMLMDEEIAGCSGR